MAFDWIKVCKDTPSKPEITILGGLLGISHEAAFLQWFMAYSWADGITADGSVPFLSLENGDSLSRCCPGTFAAMASKRIKWIEPIDGDWSNGFRFTKWERHNGSCAKKRASEAEKKRKQRSMSPALSQNCPDDNGTNVPQETVLEKRREEKRKNTPKSPQGDLCLPLPKELDTPELQDAWKAWLRHRKESRNPATSVSQERAIKKLLEMGATRALAALNHSVANGWKGLFEPSGNQVRDKPKKPWPDSNGLWTYDENRNLIQVYR